MVPRHIAALAAERLRWFPAVTLLGPRQCGKTTFARSLGRHYFNLEEPGARTRLDATWSEVMSARELVVFDEAQLWPELFRRLRGAIDDDRKRTGRFLLLGSVSTGLMREVSESLAGRMAGLELTPFALGEVEDLERLWRLGGFPDGGVLGQPVFPSWQESYLDAMAGRDLPAWGLPAKAVLTRRLFQMIAAEQGAILNLSKLGQSLGLSYHTVESYLDYLEGAFLIRRLPPFEANLRKRLVKSPRIYWRDSGLLHALLRWRTDDDLFGQPWVGASWEGFVIEQILSVRRTRGESFEAFFFRTHDGHEVDLVLDFGRQREAIEIKLTSGPTPEDLERLGEVAVMVKATRQVLLCRVDESVTTGSRWVCGLQDYLAACAK